ncbi:unnamed protein product, partial [Phaeothamnion confervicola]
MPEITFARAVSWVWTIMGILLLLIGARHCRSTSEVTTLKCDASLCTFSSTRPGAARQVKGCLELVSFPRESLIRAEQVKLRNGEIVDTKGLPRRKQKTLAQTYAITWQFFGDDGAVVSSATVPMSRRGVGRRRPRESVQAIMEYVRRETHSLDVTEQKWTSAVGMILLIIGTLVLIMRLAVGNL